MQILLLVKIDLSFKHIALRIWEKKLRSVFYIIPQKDGILVILQRLRRASIGLEEFNILGKDNIIIITVSARIRAGQKALQ